VTVLLFSSEPGPRRRAFASAAAAIDLDLLVFADVSVDEVLAALRGSHAHAPQAIDGIVAADDRAAVLAARVAQELGIAWHPVQGVHVSQRPLLMLGRLLSIDLPAPWFFTTPLDISVDDIADRLRFPCAVVPLDRVGRAIAMPAMRADTVDELDAALARLRSDALTGGAAGESNTESIGESNAESIGELLIEAFIDGRGYTVEGVLEQGALRVFAIYDEHGTPSSFSTQVARRIAGTLAHAAGTMGLRHGPIHGECRVNEAGVFVLTIAARSGDGAAAQALRFASVTRTGITLEELILRHAIGEPLDGYGREAASGS
jgi:hypothetical protein